MGVTICDGMPPPQLKLWRRYIDDIVIVWEGSEASYLEFVHSLNQNDYNLKFSGDNSTTSIHFLDLEIFIEDCTIHTKTYFKETNVNSYLHPSSCHDYCWIRNIPFNQFLRFMRNNTKEQSDFLKERFLGKDYDKDLIDMALDKAKKVKRQSLLKYGKNTGDKRVISQKGAGVGQGASKTAYVFITQFNEAHSSIKHVLNKHWRVLQMDPILGPLVKTKPKVVFKWAQNLKGLLAPSQVPSLTNVPNTIRSSLGIVGNYKCGKCKACNFVTVNKQVMSSVTKKIYKVRNCINCLSTHIVYVLQCQCGLQYIDKTKGVFKLRMMEHIRNIKNILKIEAKGLPLTPLLKHFKEVHKCDPSSISFMEIESVPRNSRQGNRDLQLLKREQYWIYVFGCKYPKGFNELIELTPFLK
ncbi:uncharacterized protein LOC142467837 [Ascaphus truei]|uniref:uncharacterized protein LOC142467837 n=1 Tax=Ascaphus truei TaxID=8439 RepID=UPI003F596EB4